MVCLVRNGKKKKRKKKMQNEKVENMLELYDLNYEAWTRILGYG